MNFQNSRKIKKSFGGFSKVISGRNYLKEILEEYVRESIKKIAGRFPNESVEEILK